MGCFRACFSRSKSRKLGRSGVGTSFRDHIKRPAEAIHPADFEPRSRGELEKLAGKSSSSGPQIEFRENDRELLLATTAKKKVISDLPIKDNASDPTQRSSTIYPADQPQNDTDHGTFGQNTQKKERQSSDQKNAQEAESTVDIDDCLSADTIAEKNCVEKDNGREENEERIEYLVESKALAYPANHRYRNCNVESKDGEFKDKSRVERADMEEEIEEALPYYPANHRYGNCNSSDDGSEGMGFEDNNLIEEDEQKTDQNESVIHPESSGSLFSLSIDFKAQCSVHENEEKEVNSTVKMSESPDLEAMEVDRMNQNEPVSGHRVDSVLNPVENLTRWIAANEKTAQTFGHHQEKENISLERDYKSRERNSNHRIAVDTSLSSWLVESENTPKSKNSDNSIGNYSPLEKGSSVRSYEDRPILGALTMDDLKQFSASPSPIRSRSRSPVETPIIGSVGSYWTRSPKDIKQFSSSSSPIRSRSQSPVETPIIGTVGSYWSHANSPREENTRRQKTPFSTRLEKAVEGNLAEV